MQPLSSVGLSYLGAGAVRGSGREEEVGRFGLRRELHLPPCSARAAASGAGSTSGSAGPSATAWLKVRVVTTERAKHFYNPQEIPVTLYSDTEEWQLWKGRTDPVLHIDLRRWADLMLVAPLDANTLAKIANGICDNLLTCVIRAWDMTKPLLFCPAMNTAMWEHPITTQQVEQLKDFGYTEIPCVVKKLVCGDEGRGAMAEVWTIVEKVKAILSERDLLTQS
ncbi:phosphopantothenoylcysteine decarboxylase isoform X1 [Chrysemys picta bellii]|uniref:phosphopantothenoylcysteine decarboxylase isoform X1 n=1 Tax=Chrysemys picta bellii TaxID=8478 RepID=UPI0032B18922